MSLFTSDLTQDKEQILLDLINHDNGTNFKVGDFMIEDISPLTSDTHNTRISVLGMRPGKVYGQTQLDYTRPNIGELPNADKCGIYIGDKARFSDLIETLNGILKINLKEDDYVDEVLPSMSGLPRGSKTVVTLYVTHDNPIYVGSIDLTVFV